MTSSFDSCRSPSIFDIPFTASRVLICPHPSTLAHYRRFSALILLFLTLKLIPFSSSSQDFLCFVPVSQFIVPRPSLLYAQSNFFSRRCYVVYLARQTVLRCLVGKRKETATCPI